MIRVRSRLRGLWFITRRARPATLVGVALGFTAFVAGCWLFASTVRWLWGALVIDDAFITYRYADNWARGAGPTWNRGDPPVEGHSTPLFTFLLALLRWGTGIPVDRLAPWLCLVFGVATLAVFGWLCWRLTRSLAWSLGGTGLLACSPSLAVWSMGGMETSLYALLCVTLMAALLGALETNASRSWVGVGALLFLLAQTRTEGPFALLAVGVLIAFERTAAWPTRTIARTALWLGAALLLCEGLRLAYYGLPVPLPVYRKAGALLNEGPVVEFLRGNAVILALLLLGLLLSERGPVRQVLQWAVLAVALLLGIVVNADGAMGVHGRYVLAAVPLLYAGAVVGAQALARRWESGWGALAVLALLGLAQGRTFVVGNREETLRQAKRYSEGLQQSHVAAGKWLATATEDKNLLAVAGDCGVLPYFAGLRFIDVEGLNDRHIARHGYDVDYVFGRNPELIVTRPANWDLPLLKDPRLHQRYSRVKSFPGFYELVVWRRNDVTLRP